MNSQLNTQYGLSAISVIVSYLKVYLRKNVDESRELFSTTLEREFDLEALMSVSIDSCRDVNENICLECSFKTVLPSFRRYIAFQ